MKKNMLLLAVQMLVGTIFAQTKTLPPAMVKTLEGQTVNVQDLGNMGKITVIICWATWELSSKNELDAIRDYYPDWRENYGVEVVAISEDDARTIAKIPSVVESKGWEYRVLRDDSREFQSAMNFASVPYTIVLDKSGNIALEHSGYAPDYALELEEKIKSLAK